MTQMTAGMLLLAFVVLEMSAVFGVAYKVLSSLRRKGRADLRPQLLVKKVFGSIDLWASITCSPLVLAFVFQCMENPTWQRVTFTAITCGFGCDTIAAALMRRR